MLHGVLLKKYNKQKHTKQVVDSIVFIVIGDVHGRKFWKEAIPYNDIPIIFVGDYLDPYTSIEDITSKDAISNFKEVMDYARGNKNVHLLYGNHDSYAFRSTALCAVRHDWVRYEDICKLYSDNKELFTMSFDLKHGNVRYLFTHAGFTPYWLRTYGKALYGGRYRLNAKTINKPFENEYPYGGKEGFRALCEIGYKRGGLDPTGSFLWADFEEHAELASIEQKTIPKNIIQVFGHSWLKESIHVKGSYEFCCVDCKEAIYLDDKGTFRYLKDGKPVRKAELDVQDKIKTQKNK